MRDFFETILFEIKAFIGCITYPFWRKRYEKRVKELINKSLQVEEIMKQSGYCKGNESMKEVVEEFFNEF